MKPNPDIGPLAERIEELRRAAGLSLYELARRSGVNRSQLTRITQGETRQPATETLNGLARALEIDPEDLYDLASATGPLPSLPTYFRSKYQLTDEQIAAVERTVNDVSRPTKTAKSRRHMGSN